MALLLSWLLGAALYWGIDRVLGTAFPWLIGVAWCVSGVFHYLLTRSYLSWAGQWMLSSTAGWSLGWLVGWSFDHNTNWDSVSVLIWAIGGALLCGLSATILSALQEEGLEMRLVFTAIGSVIGAVLGYALWELLGASEWTMLTLLVALYLLAGLMITILIVLIADRRFGWMDKFFTTILAASLIGGLSWLLVTLISTRLGPLIQPWTWTTTTYRILAGNLAGAFGGTQIALASYSAWSGRWMKPIWIGTAMAWSVLAGVVPLYVTGIWPNLTPNLVSTVQVLIPIPIWLWLLEKPALVRQLQTTDHVEAGTALRLLRLRGWISGDLLKRADLTNVDFAGLDLAHLDLSGARLHGADLSDTNLIASLLIGCDLRGADLSGANLNQTVLQKANLRGADLRTASLDKAILHNAAYDDETYWPEEFSFATCGALGPGAILQGSALGGAHINGINLSGADLRRADLSRATFNGTNLFAANLRHADLTGADFSRARLKEAQLHDARYDEQTKWPKGIDPEEQGAILAG